MGSIALDSMGERPKERAIPMQKYSEPMLSVLVVEDEWLVRAVIVAYLEEAGSRSSRPDSGESALAVLRAGEKVALYVPTSDCPGISMVGMSGKALGRYAPTFR